MNGDLLRAHFTSQIFFLATVGWRQDLAVFVFFSPLVSRDGVLVLKHPEVKSFEAVLGALGEPVAWTPRYGSPSIVPRGSGEWYL